MIVIIQGKIQVRTEWRLHFNLLHSSTASRKCEGRSNTKEEIQEHFLCFAGCVCVSSPNRDQVARKHNLYLM